MWSTAGVKGALVEFLVTPPNYIRCGYMSTVQFNSRRQSELALLDHGHWRLEAGLENRFQIIERQQFKI
jgi:hypothetical protein